MRLRHLFVVALLLVASPAISQEHIARLELEGDLKFGLIADARAFAQPTQKIELGDATSVYEFRLRSFDSAAGPDRNVKVWKGDAFNVSTAERAGRVTFFTVNNITMGFASTREGLLERYPSGAVTLTSWADVAKRSNDVGLRQPTTIRIIDELTSPAKARKPKAPPVVDLALPWTDGAVDHWATGSREALRALQTAAEVFLNDALTKSGAAAGTIRVVGIESQTTWNPDDPRLKQSNCLSGPCGQVAREAGLAVRNTTNADLVLTLVGTTGIPGAGGYADYYTGNKEKAYGVVSVAGFFALLLHELGHLMVPNWDHREAYVQCGPTDPALKYATNGWGTGTASSLPGPSKCEPGMVLVDQISNPNRNFGGFPTGDKQHDMARKVRKNFKGIGNFRH